MTGVLEAAIVEARVQAVRQVATELNIDLPDGPGRTEDNLRFCIANEMRQRLLVARAYGEAEEQRRLRRVLGL